MLYFYEYDIILFKEKFQVIIPTTMLLYLVNLNIFVFDVNMDDIYCMRIGVMGKTLLHKHHDLYCKHLY